MYKMLVVDDEPNMVEGITHGISWRQYEVGEVFAAYNAMEAMDICGQEEPEIIITDIRMPGMDGLEFVDKIREELPDTEILLISAFEEFAYAKRAIGLKVASYLVKPVRPRDLIREVCMCIKRMDEKKERREYQEYLENAYRKNRGFVSEYIIQMWMNGASISDTLLEKAMIKTGFRIQNRRFGAFVLENRMGRRLNDPLQNDLGVKEQVLGLLSDMMKQDFDILPSGLRPGKIQVLYSSALEEDRIFQSLNSICRFARDMVRQKQESTLYYGIGGVVEHPGQLPMSLKQAVSRLKRTAGSNIGRPTLGTREMQGTKENLLDDLTGFLSRYEEKLLSGAAEEAELMIEQELKQLTEPTGPAGAYAGMVYHHLLSIVLHIMQENNIRSDSLTDTCRQFYGALERDEASELLHEAFIKIHREAMGHMESRTGEISRRIAEQSKAFINSHIVNVTLAETAEAVDLSPSYFSRLFKNEVGMSFVEYCKSAKVERAKHLLRSTDKKIYEICDELGYQSVQYFTTLFKTIAGCTPGEYRQGPKPGADPGGESRLRDSPE